MLANATSPDSGEASRCGGVRAGDARPYGFYHTANHDCRGDHWSPDNPSVAFGDSSLYTREPLGRWGIGPYK